MGRTRHRCALCEHSKEKCDCARPHCTQCVRKAEERSKLRPGQKVSAAELCVYPHLFDKSEKSVMLLHSVVRQTAKLIGQLDEADLDRKRRQREALEHQILEEQCGQENRLPCNDAARVSKLAKAMTLAVQGEQPKAPVTVTPRTGTDIKQVALSIVKSLKMTVNVEGVAGVGGNGGVICVAHPALQTKKFALKISKTRLEGDTALHCDCSALQLEYQHLVLLHCVPNVVRLATVPGFNDCLAHVHHDKDDNRKSVLEYIGLFMEWVPSIPLGRAGELREWRELQAAVCIRELVLGMHVIHNLTLIHADIKASNVLIRCDLSGVTIVDLGNTVVANCGLCKYGTAGFRVPEVRMNTDESEHKKNASARAIEIWAVGVTSLQFAVGRENLVPSQEGDVQGDRGARQEAKLAEKAAMGEAGWVKKWVQKHFGEDSALQDDGKALGLAEGMVYYFIESALNTDESKCTSALKDFLNSLLLPAPKEGEQAAEQAEEVAEEVKQG